jgi:hypothetical protein
MGVGSSGRGFAASVGWVTELGASLEATPSGRGQADHFNNRREIAPFCNILKCLYFLPRGKILP